MKQSTLKQHKEATMLCETNMITIEARTALLVPQSTKQIVPNKHKVIHGRLTNIAQIVG
jgi:hypothetical protein